ncbi:MAG: PorP/SprF family type IX secretion system membrane protein [Flavobacteriaceae bacterium]|nr:PorP/SprF family type IX secretion system membrane protein [Flavobacteriaceae bacterium]
MRKSNNNLNKMKSVKILERSILQRKSKTSVFRKEILLTLISLLVLSLSYGQQESKLTLFHKNLQMLNPAIAGANDFTQVAASFRTQWIGVDGAPALQTVAFGMPVGSSLGIGLNMVNDRVFVERQTYVTADISYGIDINDATSLYLGIRGGGVFNNIDINKLVGGDPTHSLKQNSFQPNVGVGAYLYHEDFFVSLSAPKLLKNERIIQENADSGTETVVASDNMHLYATAGYNLAVSDKFTLKPAAIVRYVSGAPLSIDGALGFEYNKKFELGGYYSSDELLGGYLTAKIEWLQIGYSYANSSNSELQNSAGGIHEFFVKFSFERDKEEVPEE